MSNKYKQPIMRAENITVILPEKPIEGKKKNKCKVHIYFFCPCREYCGEFIEDKKFPKACGNTFNCSIYEEHCKRNTHLLRVHEFE
jgi:hypothetical protein